MGEKNWLTRVGQKKVGDKNWLTRVGQKKVGEKNWQKYRGWQKKVGEIPSYQINSRIFKKIYILDIAKKNYTSLGGGDSRWYFLGGKGSLKVPSLSTLPLIFCRTSIYGGEDVGLCFRTCLSPIPPSPTKHFL